MSPLRPFFTLWLIVVLGTLVGCSLRASPVAAQADELSSDTLATPSPLPPLDTLRGPVGFSNLERTQPMDAYRLPDWHYSTLTLQGNLSGDRETRSTERESDPSLTTDNTSTDIRLSVLPRYRGFWENEKRVLYLSVDPSLDFERRSDDDEERMVDQVVTDERTFNRLRFGVRNQLTYDRYVSESVFLRLHESVNYGYERDADERRRSDESPSEAIDETRTTFSYDVRAQVGIGLGRVRDVTPVVQALRVDERLRAIGDDGLSDEEVQVAARQLARRFGYTSVYDRPNKYFWGRFFDRLGQRVGLSALETFYVADVLREPLGRRHQGADLVLSPTLNVFNGRDDEGRAALWGAEATARWFENPNLRNQLSARFESQLQYGRGDAAPSWEWRVFASGSWLWVLADRVQLDSGLFASIEGVRDERYLSIGPEETRRRQFYTIESGLTVFIENSLTLNLGASIDHRRITGEDQTFAQWDLRANASIRYFLFRSLR
jgi:hypothetical protein